MINLLAPEMKRHIRAARVNVILRRYSILLGLTTLTVAGIFGGGAWLTWQERAEAETRTSHNNQVAAAYGNTRAQAESFIADLKQAKTILGGDISFYNFINHIAAVVPPGVILSNLSLGTTSLTTPMSISARSTTYENAVKLKNNLADSPLFDTVNLLSATAATSNSDPTTTKYPVTVTLSATLSKDFATELSK